MAGIYLHIPFCKQACHYCDFHFSTDLKHYQELISALVAEILLQKEFLRPPIQTVYFGGGTPSLLDTASLQRLLEAVHSTFQLAPDAEITLEANPDDLTPSKLKEIKRAGINRLSIGVQSFDNALLHDLNRVHSGSAAHQCLNDAQEAGFANFSLDLIYAIPGLTLSQWKETLLQAINHHPAHISTYCLTIEEKTVFGRWSKKGRLKAVDEETAAEQFELLQSVMDSSGYDQYEISNFCKPGFLSRHNSSYWLQEPYLGIGPSAHSFDGNRRYFNIRNNALYVKSIGEGKLASESELLTRENKINEYILTRLRTQWGCDLEFLRREFQDDLALRCSPALARMQGASLVNLSDGILRLTRKGKLLADKITEDLLV